MSEESKNNENLNEENINEEYKIEFVKTGNIYYDTLANRYPSYFSFRKEEVLYKDGYFSKFLK